jgi:hypothetical protein
VSYRKASEIEWEPKWGPHLVKGGTPSDVARSDSSSAAETASSDLIVKDGAIAMQ